MFDTMQPLFSAANQDCHKKAGEMEKMRKGSDELASQAKMYMEQTAEFQKQIVTLRESRALLDQKQRMREDRATRMSFQFKTILSQMKQAQVDAFVAQERNLKLLGVISRSQSGQGCLGEIDPHFQHAKHQPAGVQQKTHEPDENPITNGSNCAGRSAKIPASSRTTKTESPRLDYTANANFSGFSQTDMQLPSPYQEDDIRQVRSPRSFPKMFQRNDTNDLPVPVGQQQPTETHTGYNINYLAIGGSPVCAGTMTEAFSSEEKSSSTDSVSRESKIWNMNHPNTAKFDEDQGLQPLCKNNENVVGHDGGMKDSPLSEAGAPINTPNKEENSDRPSLEMPTMLELEPRNALLKIEKNDFFPDVGDRVVYGRSVEGSEILSCSDVSQKQVEQAKSNDTEATSSLTSHKTGCSLTSGLVAQNEEKENVRDLITSWSPDEKLSVLTTLKNTMMLWEDQSCQFGCWPESEILLSSLFAAKDSQLKLFEYLEVQEDISRPLTCCGAVYELVKSYPPEKLVPFKFITDFFASDDWNSGLHEGITFQHLEVYQDEHSQFWQMLVHHSICVSDLGIGTLKEVATVLREILCPRDLLEELSPEIALNVHQNLLNFLTEGIKDREAGQSHSILEETDGSSIPLSYNFMVPVEKSLLCEVKRPQTYRVEAAGPSIRDVVVSDGLELSLLCYDSMDVATGYKSHRSGRSRSSKKGLFYSLTSLVRTPFKLWRSRGMSNGAESVDDGFVRLLSKRRVLTRG